MRFWVVGTDLRESRIVAMHQAALDHNGLPGICEAHELAPRELGELLSALRSGAVEGVALLGECQAAVTPICDVLTGDAALLGVANTVVRIGDELVGDNTGAVGFELGLSVGRLWPQPHSSALVLGGGAQAATALLALSRVPAADIVVTARREEAALDLADRFAGVAPVRALPWDASVLLRWAGACNLMVNCTSAGAESLPVQPGDLAADASVADMRLASDLVHAARAAHRRACDGVEVMIHAQMLAFSRWTRTDPPFEAARRVAAGGGSPSALVGSAW